MPYIASFYLDLLYVILIITALFILTYAVISHFYKKTEYYCVTHLSYLQMRLDKGRAGEYYTYKYLRSLSGTRRFLFNCYLPKDDGSTTEIDVIMIHESGIYVFESKNFSGWIFGTETQPKWTQTLSVGKGKSQKYSFFNPIMQNKGHIKWLQTYLESTLSDISLKSSLPFYSFIVFSDRCTLKNIKLTSDSHFVINRYNIFSAVSSQINKSGVILSQDKIELLYEKLYPLSQADNSLKMAHNENVQQKRSISKSEATDTSTASADSESICPRCGGHLVLRTANKGKHIGQRFYGCSNYPRCRYTSTIDGQ